MTRAHLVTFSDESMSRSADLCVGSGSRYGCDKLTRFEYGPFTGSKIFEENEGLFLQSRGMGYWAWKPVIINWTLTNYREQYIVNPHGVEDGDIVIYADAGIEFIAPVSHIINRMDQDIFLFGNNWEHAHWCKRDVVEAVWAQPRLTNEERIARILEIEKTTWGGNVIEAIDTILKGEVSESVLHDILWNQFGKQAQASVIFFRVSDYTRKFVKEWLHWCLFEGGRLIDDSPSLLPNHPEFREHRHDQAILTTMAYREGVRLHWWPAVYNRFSGPEFIYEKGEYQDNYPPLFHHHRRRNDEWPATS